MTWIYIMCYIYSKWCNNFSVPDINDRWTGICSIINMHHLKFSLCCVSAGLKQWACEASAHHSIMLWLGWVRCAAERRSILWAWNLKLGGYSILLQRTCPRALHTQRPAAEAGYLCCLIETRSTAEASSSSGLSCPICLQSLKCNVRA